MYADISSQITRQQLSLIITASFKYSTDEPSEICFVFRGPTFHVAVWRLPINEVNGLGSFKIRLVVLYVVVAGRRNRKPISDRLLHNDIPHSRAGAKSQMDGGDV